jgi:hypothetical protein
VPAWVPTAFVAATIVLVPWFVTVLLLIQRTDELHNLRLFWTGLDIFELVSMAASGWYLYRRSPYVAVSAMVTAALLFSDAWFNVVTTAVVGCRADDRQDAAGFPRARLWLRCPGARRGGR